MNDTDTTHTDPPGTWHPFGRTRAEDLELLAHGHHTGWWGHHGRPEPWPQDYLNPHAGWAHDPAHDPGTTPENPPY